MNIAAHAGPGFVNAAGLSFTLAMVLLLLVLPRKYVLVPIIVLVCFMTMGEHLIIAGLNFTMIRVLLIFGWLRLILRGEYRRLRWTTVDKLIIAWVCLRTVNYVLVWGSSAALVNRLGYAYDILGSYFLFRFLVRNHQDVYRAIRYLAVFIAPLAAFMIAEKLTGRNSFAIFGATPITEMREGVVRCQGPFGVSILAGTFAATTMPLFVGAWSYRRSAFLFTIAISATLVITITSGSSGPVLAYAAAVLGLLFWRFRRNMRMVRWGVVFILVALQIAMSQPVWFVMARLTVFSGSTGWYRGFLIDMTVRHFTDWFFIGSNANAQWHGFLADVTNQYILEALDGGLVVAILFVAILAFSFREVGRVVLSQRFTPGVRRLAWAMGAALFAHSVSFFSVSYFDQNVIVYYLLLAGITVLRVEPHTAPERRHTHSPSRFPSEFPMAELTR